jgi:nucleoid-associated protein YgaU
VKTNWCSLVRKFAVFAAFICAAVVMPSCVSGGEQPEAGVAAPATDSQAVAPAVATTETLVAEPTPELPPTKKSKKRGSKHSVRINASQMDAESSYVVQEGDTLGTISQKVFGTCKLAKKLAKLNNIKNYDKIRVGDVLLVKTKIASQSQARSQIVAREGSSDKVVKVVKGDSLWKIAARELGTPYAWRQIVASNPSIQNSAMISEGMNLVIPGQTKVVDK